MIVRIMQLKRLTFVVVAIAIIMVDESDCYFGDSLTLYVKHKFAGQPKNLIAMKAHDTRRHARLLSTANIDVSLGGNGQMSEDGLYYAKVQLGEPPQDYHVHVDTGVDLFWIDCVTCAKCAQKSYLAIALHRYDPKKSNTSSLVYCNNKFCTMIHEGNSTKCKPDQLCKYSAIYPDNSGSTGYLVKDTIQLQKVNGSPHTEATNGTVVFGCGNTRTYGNSDTIDGDVDGVLGFGQGNASLISQLAQSGVVKKIFAHCLDNVEGGGIFTIGEVVSPEMNKTRMIKKQYKIKMKNMQIGNDTIDDWTGEENRVLLDSGSSLAYLPAKIYKKVIEKISSVPSVKLVKGENFTCFTYDESIDDAFPIVSFNFQGSLTLKVYPRDYLFQTDDEKWCIGWLQSERNEEGSHILLGDMALANKLVVYDMENYTIGWTEYKCNSTIQVHDEKTGKNQTVGPHNIGSTLSFNVAGFFKLSSMIISLLHFFV